MISRLTLIAKHCHLLCALFLILFHYGAIASVHINRAKPQPTITKIIFLINGKKIPDDSSRLERLRRICGISSAQPLSAYAVGNSIKKLYATGEFSQIEVLKQKVFGGVVLRFQLTEKVLIELIKLSGNRLADEMIRDVIKSRAGGEYIEAVAREDRQRIQDLYLDQGYFQVQVRFSAPAPSQIKGPVTLTYNVNEGSRSVIREFLFSGNASIPSERLKRSLKSKIGKPYAKQLVERDIQHLMSLYRRDGFLNTRVHTERHLDVAELSLTFKIVEGKKVTVKGIDDDELRNRMSLFKQNSYSDAILESNREQIRQFYRQKGYYDPSVDYRIEKDTEREVVIRFVIDLGLAPRIGQITFEGNNEFKRTDLLNAMKTRTHSRWALPGLRWLFSKGIFDSLVFETDIRALELLYRKEGYPDVRVDVREEIDAANERLNLHIIVNEGEQQIIRRVTVTGNRIFKTEELLSQLDAEPGKPYSKEGIAVDDYSKLLSLYDKKGHIYVIVQPEYNALLFQTRLRRPDNWDALENRLPEKFSIRAPESFRELLEGASTRDVEAGTPTLHLSPNVFIEKRERGWLMTDQDTGRSYIVDREDNTLNIYEIGLLRYNITEREQVIFGEFSFSSSPSTGFLDDNRSSSFRGDMGNSADSTSSVDATPGIREHVLRREFESLGLREGAVFNPDELREAQRRLSRLGIFRRVGIETPGSREDKEVLEDIAALDVNVHAELRQPGSISVRGGYSPSEGIRGTLAVLHSNLYQRNMRAGAKLSAGTRGNLYELTLIEPWLIGPTMGTLRIFEDNLEEQDNTRARGATANLARRLSLYSNAAVQYKYQELTQRIELARAPESPNAVLPTERHTTVSSLGLSFHRDNREPFLNPSDGWLNEFAVEYAGGFIGGKSSFFKLTGDNRFYSRIGDMVLVNALRLGYARGLRSNREREIVSFERFKAGGSTTIRGYRDRSLGPLDDELSNTHRGDVLFIYNVELRFPLYKLFGGALFFDTGNVWDNLASIDTDPLHSAIGVGVRVDTPLGPARVDYGFPLVGDESPQVSLGLGHAF
ncbi:MAG: BamA/TamA family outer membrane protein [Candidatus Poribacteria bacterium]|nr:BamA/TamA family outer membrane protein [Candidatus Poribacteria bacterium]MDE0504598.1 BamA/TamA family outer membrane protein [Candidatus Poribacteria bacterium]